ECSGLYWDCVKFDARLILVRRIWRNGKGIVPSTKTGERGKRDIPMSPILYAELQDYATHLQRMGYALDGPVLRTKRAPIITASETCWHWNAIAAKAGFVNQDGDQKYTYYDLRHTAANLWRSVMDLDQVKDLMGHETIDTTDANYRHRTPFFYELRHEIR